MQIQTNYNSRSGEKYSKPHARHTEERFQDYEEKARGGGEAAGRKESLPPGGRPVKSDAEEGVIYERSNRQTKQEDVIPKGKGKGMLRQIWDSMGDEKQMPLETEPLEEGRAGEDERGIFAVSSSIRNLIPSYITEKWEEVKDRVKESAGAAFEKFNKSKDAFLALSDPGRRFLGKKEERQKREERAGRRTKRPKPEILLAATSDTHLTDSYSKSGEYCKLNDHLTYNRQQRLLENRRAFSENADGPDRQGNQREDLKETAKRVDKRL